MKRLILISTTIFALACSSPEPPPAAEPPSPHVLTYEGAEGPGKGKHVVLISGDEEYRSEEGLPQLAKILATHHGFKTTVLFAIDPDSGIVNPHVNTNIPGTDALDSADLMVILTRWRRLPDDQMAPIDRFLKAGKPIVGLRTATHAFAPPTEPHKAVTLIFANTAMPRTQARSRFPKFLKPSGAPTATTATGIPALKLNGEMVSAA